jgi:mono/diheme cytochrome c family protein
MSPAPNAPQCRALIFDKPRATAARQNQPPQPTTGNAEVMSMARLSMFAQGRFGKRPPAAGRRLPRSAAFAATLLLAGCLASCAVEVQNTQPAKELAQLAGPPGSVYTGWRVFQDKCSTCHGPAATGGSGGPDLLPRVREMGARRFVGLVLNRYDWTLPPAQARSQGAAREALIDDIVQRKQGMLTMPAWQSEPPVNAHIVDLFAYLSARAEGTQGTGRPVQ